MAVGSLHVERLDPSGTATQGSESAGARLVLVHGFTQTGRCWGRFGADLAVDHEALSVDAPGHGGSSEVRIDLDEGAKRLGEAGGRAIYVGYSMGGRLALHLALARPDLVRGLVLIGATAGIADDAERAERRAADDALAAHLEQVGVDAFLHEWLAQPLFAHLPDDAASLDERRRNTVAGLASSLRLAGTGSQRPLWAELGRITAPVLLLSGEHDPKFTGIARQMAEHIGPNATAMVVEGAGHSAHLEQPEHTTRCVRTWLGSRTPSRRRPVADREQIGDGPTG